MLSRFNAILVTALAVSFGATSAFAQVGKPQDPKDPPGVKKLEHVTVVFIGNTQDPVDGKTISDGHDKFVEVDDGQRIYVSSDASIQLIKKDTKGMLAKAYGNAVPVPSKICPIDGKTLGGAGSPNPGTEVTFQGRKLSICSPAELPLFKKSPHLYIAKALFPDTKDAANPVDPVDGKPVDATILAIYKGRIFHFSSTQSVGLFSKDPEAYAAKIKS